MIWRRLLVFTLAFSVMMTIYLVSAHDFTSYEQRKEVATEFLKSYGYTQPQISRILNAN